MCSVQWKKAFHNLERFLYIVTYRSYETEQIFAGPSICVLSHTYGKIDKKVKVPRAWYECRRSILHVQATGGRLKTSKGQLKTSV